MRDIATYFSNPTKIDIFSKGPASDISNEQISNQEANCENIKQTLNLAESNTSIRKGAKNTQKTPELGTPELTKSLPQSLDLSFPTGSAKMVTLSSKYELLMDSNNEVKNILVNDCDKGPTKTFLESSPKVNAFHFLMNSHNNVIGRNLEGKSLDLELLDNPTDKDREKLKARKQLFEDWADKKGSSKRKLEDEHFDQCNKMQMEKRTKRFKKLLKVDEVDRKSKHPVSTPISIEPKGKDLLISKNIKKKQNNNESGDLLNFVDTDNKTLRKDLLKVYDDTENKTINVIKVKMFSAKKQKLQKSLDSVDQLKKNVIVKINKMRNNEKKDDSMLNNSVEDFCLLETSNKKQVKFVDTQTKCSFMENLVNITQANLSDDSANVLAKLNKKTDKSLKVSQNCGKNNAKKIAVQNIEIESDGRLLRKRTTINYKELDNGERQIPDKKRKEKLKLLPKSKNIRKHGSVENIILSSDSENEVLIQRTPKTIKKMAPIFLKVTPKPKIDLDTIEARKHFLLSGIPDSLKKNGAKYKRLQDKQFEVFPMISHIQQKCESKLWVLSKVNLLLADTPISFIEDHNLPCKDLVKKILPYQVSLTRQTEKVKHMKSWLYKIKLQNPLYPVFKLFKHIFEKKGNIVIKNSSERKTEKKLEQINVDNSKQLSNKHYEMWTEKYKPTISNEVLGNHKAINELKKWLEAWRDYSENINDKKKYKLNCNSESEFESTDCDSRDSSTWLPINTTVLYGPCGSGKTNAVYAVAHELKLNVLELNASTKRTGKKLLQELQEATQSHQVRKNESIKSNSLSSFKCKKVNKKNLHCEHGDAASKKMCILLLEDVDLIFDQDDGFLSSLSQLIVTSKRPIILTTTDSSPSHVQKFISQYKYISFLPLSLQCLGVWLQIVCLVEGLLVDKDALGNLLEYNKGDIRKTILELQFWCQSGGQLDRGSFLPLKFHNNSNGIMNSELTMSDDEYNQNLSEEDTDNKEQFVHNHCLRSFEVFRLNQEYVIPENVDLGLLWWNFPNLIDVQSGALNRLQGQNAEILNREVNFLLIMNIYESFCLTDLLHKSLKADMAQEPTVNSGPKRILDSLELNERKEYCDGFCLDLVHDLTHILMNGCIDNYRKNQGTNCTINMALPDAPERRWRANRTSCEAYLKTAVPLSVVLDRKSAALDYLPALRDIARFEERRAATNTTRRNRFRHYFRDLMMDFKSDTCKLASQILNRI